MLPNHLNQTECALIANIIDCKVTSLPITYLGVPLHCRRLKTEDWKIIINKIQKKLDNWKDKILSLGDRVILVNAVLSAIPIYWLTIFKIPVKVRKIIDKIRRNFYGQEILLIQKNLV